MAIYDIAPVSKKYSAGEGDAECETMRGADLDECDRPVALVLWKIGQDALVHRACSETMASVANTVKSGDGCSAQDIAAHSNGLNLNLSASHAGDLGWILVLVDGTRLERSGR
jgi:hypothetical protein